MPEPDKLHVVCHRPGLIRGGRPNPAHAVYSHGDITPEQLAELASEPQITLIVGRTLSDDDLAALAEIVAERKADEATDKKAKK